MGDDIDYDTYFTINYLGEPTLEYRPASVTRIGNNIYCEGPMQQYYSVLCNTEITEEQYPEIQKILKRQKREEEKRKTIEEFYRLTRVLEKVIDEGRLLC